MVITRVRGGAEDECNNNDNLRVQWDLGSVYFAGNGYGNIFTILPALTIGCTGKGRFGISSRLHWEGSDRQ